MTKKEMLALLRLLSALESWALSRREHLPDYLHDNLTACVDGLESHILEDKP